jgi:hypothetical protein
VNRRYQIFGCAAILSGLGTAQVYQSDLPVNHPAIRYFQDADNIVSRLAADGVKIDSLPALLVALHINPDSQALVFSKTSFQSTKISPRNPRAIYFNDDVAVGWVPGGNGIEVAAFDPRQGAVFYIFNNGEFKRSEVCLRCHQGPATVGVPGMFVGSVFPNAAGQPHGQGGIITDHRTAFGDRWGGWYVNAKRGEQKDRANSVAPDPAEPEALATEGHQNLTTLAKFFEPAGYLRPVSDIVALMTFEHQTQMMNYFTRLSWESRIGRVEDADVEAAVDYMLFAEEAPLVEPVEGVSSFTKTFPDRGPRDAKGRSLRDFDLQTRLFKYPLSYVIYSPVFDALPDAVRDRVYGRVFEVLSWKDRSEKFARLTVQDRKAILEILRDTKTSLPAYFR